MSLKNKIKSKLNGLVRRSYWFKEVAFRDCYKMVGHHDFNLDVVNLGSSSGVYAFNYENTGVKAANWALRPNPLLADYEIIRNFSSFLKPKGSVVVLPLCPFSFLSGSYDYFDDRYYTFLQLRSIPHGNFRRKAEVMNRYRHPLMHFPLMRVVSEFTHLIKKQKEALPEQAFASNAKNWLKNWLFEFNLDTIDSPLSLVNKDGIEDGKRIIKATIDYCNHCGATPVIVIPPMSSYLSSLFSQDNRNKLFLNHINEIVAEKGVRFIDYIDDPQFSNDTSLFRDAYFLNTKGAKLFTQRVLTDLGILCPTTMA